MSDQTIRRDGYVREWISVKDELPEDDQVVLVAIMYPAFSVIYDRVSYPEKRTIGTATFRRKKALSWLGHTDRRMYRDHREWRVIEYEDVGADPEDYTVVNEFEDYDDCGSIMITHWMPLPELPEEDAR